MQGIANQPTHNLLEMRKAYIMLLWSENVSDTNTGESNVNGKVYISLLNTIAKELSSRNQVVNIH